MVKYSQGSFIFKLILSNAVIHIKMDIFACCIMSFLSISFHKYCVFWTWMYTHYLYPNLPKKGGMVNLNSGTIHTKSRNWTFIDDVWIGQTVYLRFLTLFPDNETDIENLYLISTRLQQKLTPVFFWNFTLHLWQTDPCIVLYWCFGNKTTFSKYKIKKSTNQANTLL